MTVPLASPADLALAPGVSLDLADEEAVDRALRAIETAEDDVLEYLGWDPREHVATTAAGALDCWGYAPRRLFLPARYVTAAAVTVDGVVEPEEGFVWTPEGVVTLGRWVPAWSVTFTAGWPVGQVPRVFRDAVVALAAEAQAIPVAGLRSETWQTGSESGSRTWAGDSGSTASAGPLLRLRGYRLPVVV